jgi:hypothetical protein
MDELLTERQDVPRSIRAPGIESRSARLRLPGRKAPFWVTLQRGLALGYHRPLSSGAGTWWGRIRVGKRYRIGSFATADDHADADGEKILSWGQAQVVVRAWAGGQTSTGPIIVAQAVANYVADLRARKGDRVAKAVKGRLDSRLPPELSNRKAAKPDRSGHSQLAKQLGHSQRGRVRRPSNS